MKTIVGRLSLIVIGIAAISCVSKADLDEIKATQKQITAAQKQMLTKLEAIAKRPAAAAAKPQRPRGPDPQKTYAFPVEKSPSKGAKDALVTIIEVSDFQ
ncbi:MAG: hypothetical protein VX699_07855 [Myxococcota bacterium]|nr:hypothetical protein [Myxococcota bacterium]